MAQQNLFVNDNDEFEVKFAVATDKNGNIFCDMTKELLEEGIKNVSDDPANYDINSYTATFKRPSFSDAVGLYEQVFSTQDGSNVKFNPIAARYRKIILLIKHWNLKGEKEKPTEEEVMKLHPTVAAATGIQLDLEFGGMLD